MKRSNKTYDNGLFLAAYGHLNSNETQDIEDIIHDCIEKFLAAKNLNLYNHLINYNYCTKAQLENLAVLKATGLPSYRHEGARLSIHKAFEGYLYQLLKWSCWNQNKKGNKHSFEEFDYESKKHTLKDDDFLTLHIERETNKIINRLNDKIKFAIEKKYSKNNLDILIKYYAEGKTSEQLSVEYGISPDAIRVKVMRMCNYIKSKFGSDYNERI